MSYSYNEVLAKKDPDIPLFQHIEDSLKLFKPIREYKSNLIKNFCAKYSFPEEQFWESAFLIVALHDIGKASVPFQKYICKEGKMESHPFLSFWFVQQACSNYTWIEGKRREISRPIPVEALIVANHHSPFRQGKFEDYKDNQESPLLIQDTIERICQEIIKPKFNEHPGGNLSLSFEYPQTYGEIFNQYALANVLVRSASIQDRKRLRVLFSLLKSVLHYCDWYASENISSFEYFPTIKETELKKAVGERARVKDVGWYPFQTKCKNHIGGAILQAPTGKGKTEAALLWAMNNGEGKKIVYLMPTMTTTNKMHERLKRILGEDIGIVHGTSDYLLFSERDYQDTWEFRWHSLFSKAFIHKCTVATVDQLLFILFNWGKWDLRLSNAANSVLIFDEIHCYEPYTVALIVEITKLLQSLGAMPLFMSATFPTKLKEFLKAELGLDDIERDTSFDNLCRVEIEWQPYNEDKEISAAAGQIAESYQNGKKVLVICNTIRTAKEMYYRLLEFEIPSLDLLLFHSQFILYDRILREDLLENLPAGGFVAVTTQVVEVSLDIDFDLLYTEACPIDALIQRLGRVNRKGIKSEAKAYILRWSPKFGQLVKSGFCP
jgi:CRISPR-associated helicase Cas3/CRISPR-associated endonuclease Cas3-HD